MNDTEAGPWNNPPQRKLPLRRKRAQQQARRAEYWGRRLEEARKEGSHMEAAVAFDRLRKALEQLRAVDRDRAYQDVTRVLDSLRETHGQ